MKTVQIIVKTYALNKFKMNIISLKSIVFSWIKGNQCLCALECHFSSKVFSKFEMLSKFDNVLWVHYQLKWAFILN
jgi:hypothetical protein